ncbi:MAG TPA: MFS transporter, partial [Pricia sp.]|nr:MFS transporter [Pricia sp.]
MQPIFGGWVDAAREEAIAMGVTGDAMELATGQATLERMIAFPGLLIVLFTILWFWMRNKKAKDKAQAQTGAEGTAL